jgi:hypothetical protein
VNAKVVPKARFSIMVPLAMSGDDAVPLLVTVAKTIYCDYTDLGYSFILHLIFG